MIRRGLVAWGLLMLAALTACSTTVAGTATWPGATLERVLLAEHDFPVGVQYDRIRNDRPDEGGAPPSMMTKPEGCANAMTNVIVRSAERGPGSAASYSVAFDGARILITLLSWNLDLQVLAATADRCEHFETFFDADSKGIPIPTVKLPSDNGVLLYQQIME